MGQVYVQIYCTKRRVEVSGSVFEGEAKGQAIRVDTPEACLTLYFDTQEEVDALCTKISHAAQDNYNKQFPPEEERIELGHNAEPVKTAAPPKV